MAHVVVGLGEILWDVFRDGMRFGGAPANFACDVAGLSGGKADIFMVSCVGQDDPGQRALRALQEHGVDTSCVAFADHSTGRVVVELDEEGSAKFHVAENSAWDNIVWSDVLAQLAARTDAVCFGTLGQRNEVSRRTIRQFVSSTPSTCLRICDINLRPPDFDDRVLLESLNLANVVKWNDEELPVVASACGLFGSTETIIQQLMERFALRVVALTRGAQGATLWSGEGRSDHSASETQVVDTVGAGDAFTAVLALGLLAGLPLGKINEHACKVAAFVCSQHGATPKIPSHLHLG